MRTLFAAYEKLMDCVYSLIRICIAAALVVMVVVTFVEVIRRYVFGLSFIWSEELVRFLLVATSFLGGAAAYRAKALALLDLVTSHLNQSVQKGIDIVVTLVIIALCVYLCMEGYSYSFSPQIANMYSTGLNLRMTYVYLTIPIGFTLIILFGVEHLAKSFLPAPAGKTEQLEEKEG